MRKVEHSLFLIREMGAQLCVILTQSWTLKIRFRGARGRGRIIRIAIYVIKYTEISLATKWMLIPLN